MKSKDFERIFNKNANKKKGIDDNNTKGVDVSSNRTQRRSYTMTQNKGGRGK